ncbi:hypothetical protein FO519_009028 [Halicephalobus sp. NKZ332]|nr:hypothetical protein FO519_009028 [Halicephalobus sp. NKZ332]
MTYYEAVEYSACVAAILESKNLDIDYNYGLPCGDTILLTRDLISLTRLPHYVMCDPDYYLNPGDEIFVQCRTLNVGFYHSGIYAGRGKVFHFMADLSPDDSLGNVMFGPGRVHSDNWIDFVYSNLDYEPNSDITPIIYKVIYPLANPLPPKKISTEEEIAFDLPPPSPSRFTSTKAVQPISRTRLVNRPSSTTRRVVSASHVNRTPQVTRGVQRPSAPAPRRSVPAPAPVSHLSSGKRDPNSFFLSCCKHKNVAKTCESRCNFDVLTKKILTGMFLGTDSCPQSNGLDLFSCAAQDGDHTPCCRRNKVHNTSAGEKCLNFCRMTPDHNFQADASYLPCWAVLNKIKTCFKDAITN